MIRMIIIIIFDCYYDFDHEYDNYKKNKITKIQENRRRSERLYKDPTMSFEDEEKKST